MANTISIPPSHLLKQDWYKREQIFLWKNTHLDFLFSIPSHLDKSVGELLPSRIEGLLQDWHLQNPHASLLHALHGAYPTYGIIVK